MQFRAFKCNKIDESCRVYKTSQQPIEVMRLGAIEESVQNIKSGCFQIIQSIRAMIASCFFGEKIAKNLTRSWRSGGLSADTLPGTASVQGLFESRIARFHSTVMFFYAHSFIGACERLITG